VRGETTGLRRFYPALFPLALTAAVFFAWFLPGYIIGGDFIPWSTRLLESRFPWPHIWDSDHGAGRSLVVVWFGAPLFALGGWLYKAGAGWPVIERVLFLLPAVALLPTASYALLLRLTRSPWAAAIGAAVFAINPWTVALAGIGQIPSLVAFAFVPLAVLAGIRFAEQPTPLRGLAAAAALTAVALYDLRYAYITAIAALIVLAVWWKEALGAARARGGIGSLAAMGAGLLAFNLYWIVPAAVGRVGPPSHYTQLADYNAVSGLGDLLHSLTGTSPWYHQVAGSYFFGSMPIDQAFLVLPALALLAFAVLWRRRWAQCSAALLVVGIVLASGSRPPFGDFNRLVFLHVPGMALFRDASKFLALVITGYSLLFGLAAAALLGRLSETRARRLVPIVALGAIAGYGFLMHDAFNPAILSNLSAFRIPAEDGELTRFLQGSPGTFRTVCVPTVPSSLINYEAHSLLPMGDYFNAGLLEELWGVPPDIEGAVHAFHSRYAAQVLRELDVRYVVVCDDTTNSFFRPHDMFMILRGEASAILADAPYLRRVAVFGRHVVYRVTGPAAPPIFVAAAPLRYVGTPDGLDALLGTPFAAQRPAFVFGTDASQLASPDIVRNVAYASAALGPPAPDFNARAFGATDSPNPLSPLPASADFRFSVSDSGAAQLHLVAAALSHEVSLRATPGSLLESPRAERVFDPWLRYVEFDPADFTNGQAGGADAGAVLKAVSGTITLVASPLPQRLRIVVKGVRSLDGRSHRVRFSVMEDPRGRYEGVITGLPGDIAIPDATVGPGPVRLVVRCLDCDERNALRVDGIEPFIIFLDPHWSAPAAARSAVLSLWRGPPIPLYQRPRLSLRVDAPRPPAFARLRIALHDTLTGRDIDFMLVLGDRALDRLDIRRSVEEAFGGMTMLGIPPRWPKPAQSPNSTVPEELDLTGCAVEAIQIELVGPPGVPSPNPGRFTVAAASLFADEPLPKVIHIRLNGKAVGVPASHAGPDWVAGDASSGSLRRGTNLIELPQRPAATFALVSTGTPKRTREAAATGVQEVSPAEVTARLRSEGGVLVWNVAYDPQWSLALLPREATPSGNALVDSWRLRNSFLPRSAHVRVNGMVNGWVIPPGDYRLVFVYGLEALNRLGMLAWLICSVALVGGVFIARRRSAGR
jgi:hypothetical protein